MRMLQFVVDVFLWPGDMVRRTLGIEVEEDGGIIRSFVNMTVWGIVSIVAVVQIYG